MKKIYCFTYSIKKSSLFELTPYVGIKKTYSIQKLKYKIDSHWVFVRSPLYELVFVRNGLCMKRFLGVYVKYIFRYHLVQKILVRSDSHAFVRNGLPCTKWSLFEMVFVRSDCQSNLTSWLYLNVPDFKTSIFRFSSKRPVAFLWKVVNKEAVRTRVLTN